MESAVLCHKKRTAKPARVGVSYQITQYTTTDLGSETFYYSNISSGNNPIKYTDPTGEAAIAAPAVEAGIVIVGLAAGMYALHMLSEPIAKTLSDAVATAAARSNIANERHHAFPKFLGGPIEQNLVPMSHSRHVNFHKDLRNFLKSNYPEMEPKRGNSGAIIQARTSLASRKEAMAKFYLTHLDNYGDAAARFFADNPETLTEENSNWAKSKVVGERVKEAALNLITTPTEE
jgi:hypothetical protein